MALEKRSMKKTKTQEEEEEEDNDEKKNERKSESECVARFGEMLQRFAYNNPPPTLRPRVWPTTRRLLSSSSTSSSPSLNAPSDFIAHHKENTQKPQSSDSDHLPIQPILDSVSPYFQNDIDTEKDKMRRIMKETKKEGNAVRVVSPYFQAPIEEKEHNYNNNNHIEKKTNKKRLVKVVVSPYFNNSAKEYDGNVVRVVSPYFLNHEVEHVHLNNDEGEEKKKNMIMGKNDPCLEQETLIVTSAYFTREEPVEKTKSHRKEEEDICNSSDHWDQDQNHDPKEEKIVEADSELMDEQPKQKKKKRVGTTDDDNEARPIKKKRTRRKSVTLTAAEKKRDAYSKRDDSNTWIPPRSIHGLLQEYHYEDPWRVLVICILLNITSGTQVKRVIDDFFREYPDARAASEADEDTMKEIIKSLGLKNKRTETIKRMSREYLEDNWSYVTQLYGVGKYAADAYAIFCNGNWEEVIPRDHKLEDYWAFMNSVADTL